MAVIEEKSATEKKTEERLFDKRHFSGIGRSLDSMKESLSKKKYSSDKLLEDFSAVLGKEKEAVEDCQIALKVEVDNVLKKIDALTEEISSKENQLAGEISSLQNSVRLIQSNLSLLGQKQEKEQEKKPEALIKDESVQKPTLIDRTALTEMKQVLSGISRTLEKEKDSEKIIETELKELLERKKEERQNRYLDLAGEVQKLSQKLEKISKESDKKEEEIKKAMGSLQGSIKFIRSRLPGQELY